MILDKTVILWYYLQLVSNLFGGIIMQKPKDFMVVLFLAVAIVLMAKQAFGQYVTSPRGNEVIPSSPTRVSVGCTKTVRDRIVAVGVEQVSLTDLTGRLFVNDGCGKVRVTELDSDFGYVEVTIVPEAVKNVYVRLKPHIGDQYGFIYWRARSALVRYKNGAIYGFRFQDQTGNGNNGSITFREPFYPEVNKQYLLVLDIWDKKTFVHFKIDSERRVMIARGNIAFLQ